MNIKAVNNGDQTTLYLSGRLDTPGAESLKKALKEAAEENPQEISLDFEEVDYVGSACVGKLIGFYKEFSARKGKISISNLSQDVLELFRAVKLDKLFKIQ